MKQIRNFGLQLAIVLVPFFFAHSSSAQAASKSDTGNNDPTRVFGTLGSLIGTSWSIGDEEVIDISWDRPDAGILIVRRGLYGRSETIVVPSSDRRSLRYVRRGVNFGDVREGVIATPAKGQFFLKISDREQENCRQAKSGIECVTLVRAGKTWKPDVNVVPAQAQKFSLIQVNAAQVAGVLSGIALLGEYPDRPEGSYDQMLGISENAANRLWANSLLETFFELWKSNGNTHLLARNPFYGHASLSLFGSVQFSGSAQTPLVGTYLNSHSSAIYRRRTVTFSVREGGSVVICTTELNGPSNRVDESIKTCSAFRLDVSGTKMLLKHYNYQYAPERSVLYSTLPVKVAPNDASSAVGRAYRSKDGRIHYFTLSGKYNSVFACTVGQTKTSVDVDPNLTKTYRINRKGDVFLVATGEALLSVPRAAYFLASQALEDARSIATSMKVAEINRRDNQAFWSGLERDMAEMTVAVQSGAFNSNTWNAAPAYFGPTSVAGGAVGDMGGVTRTSAPPMTPSQRAEYEQLQAYNLRERIYGSGGGGSNTATVARNSSSSSGSGSSSSSSQSLDVEDMQGAEARRIDREQTVAARQAKEEQAKESAAAAERASARPKPAPSSVGIVVRDDRAEIQRDAAAQREREAAAAASAKAERERDARDAAARKAAEEAARNWRPTPVPCPDGSSSCNRARPY